ncbi:MAG: LCP family protein [Candidatus Margulisiibacteriota bacterium]|nr:LCP family protein [Candidatus Margulisiibacteriota bacterium]
MKKFVIISLSITIVFSIVIGFTMAIASKLALFELFLSLAPSNQSFSKANILVLGVDSAYGHRSDTIMVLNSDPAAKRATLISIPRDTLAVLPGRGLDKINHAYAYGGVELSKKTVENLLEIKIPYHIVVDLAGIVNIIDDLGGVPVNVEKRMYYVDYAGGLYIDLKPGQQRLSGKQVMGYLRYRKDGGDFKRIGRQQHFLRSMAKEMLKRDNILRSPKLFLTLLSYLHTNLNSRQSLGLGLGVRDAVELGNISMKTLPGSDMMVDGIYYLKPNLNKIKNMTEIFKAGSKT